MPHADKPTRTNMFNVLNPSNQGKVCPVKKGYFNAGNQLLVLPEMLILE
jgi:hypothetical protein